jgi:hypothetical protein
MTPLRYWIAALVVAAFFGTFAFEIVLGAWFSVVGIGIAAGIGAMAMIGPHDKSPKA